jgi:hypothetical protein
MTEDTAIAPQRIIQISTPEDGDGVVALDEAGELWLLPRDARLWEKLPNLPQP